MYVKKILCPEWDLNCCNPAWRSELLPTGLLGSVNRLWAIDANWRHARAFAEGR